MILRRVVPFYLLLLFVMGLYTLYMFPRLPDPMPIHWNIQGKADGYASRLWGVGLTLLIDLAVMLLMVAIPWMSPKTFKIDSFRDTYEKIAMIVGVMLTFIHVFILQAANNDKLDVGRWLICAILVALALIGNLLGKVRRNFFMGVRTPWTLASERVWNDTHRLAAKLMFFGGLAGAVAGALGLSPIVLFVWLLLISLYPVPYSFFLYKKLEREGGL